MRPCKSDWMRRSAKRRPEARWRPAATGPLMVWKVSSVSMQSRLQTLDVEQPSIGHKADLAQLRQIVQALADAEVIGVVDRSLGTQGPIFLVILLLDARVLVVHVQGRSDVLGEDKGAKPPRGAAIDLAVEDQLDLLRPAEIEVLADHLLEEQSAVRRPVEHLCQGELGLQDLRSAPVNCLLYKLSTMYTRQSDGKEITRGKGSTIRAFMPTEYRCLKPTSSTDCAKADAKKLSLS